MAHPYEKHKGKHYSRERVHKLFGKLARGGATSEEAHEAEEGRLINKLSKMHKTETKAHGNKSKGRLDKHARGGKVKHGKGHHTKINIVVAPKAGGDMPPPPMGGPMAGGPPPAMPPKTPMAPPPGPMAGGMPGIGAKPGGLPGGMKRGGHVKSGIANSANLKKWSAHASSNSRYAKGGKVHMEAGAGTGEGRLDKKRAYGHRARKNGPA